MISLINSFEHVDSNCLNSTEFFRQAASFLFATVQNHNIFSNVQLKKFSKQIKRIASNGIAKCTILHVRDFCYFFCQNLLFLILLNVWKLALFFVMKMLLDVISWMHNSTKPQMSDRVFPILQRNIT